MLGGVHISKTNNKSQQWQNVNSVAARPLQKKRGKLFMNKHGGRSTVRKKKGERRGVGERWIKYNVIMCTPGISLFFYVKCV
jgi:hypothetical protein